MTTPPALPIHEARELLERAEARLQKIRARMAELSIRAAASLSVATTHDRALATALVDGDDLAVSRLQDEALRTAGPVAAMTPAEARRGVAALKSLEAEAQAELHDARSALRRAVLLAVQEQLAATTAAYDQAAQELQARWTEVSYLWETVAAMTTHQKAPPHWHSLAIPRTEADPTPMMRLSYPATGELLTNHQYHAAAKAVLDALGERGVQRTDIGR